MLLASLTYKTKLKLIVIFSLSFQVAFIGACILMMLYIIVVKIPLILFHSPIG